MLDRDYTQGLQKALGRVANDLTSALQADGSYIYTLGIESCLIPQVAGGKINESERALFLSRVLRPSVLGQMGLQAALSQRLKSVEEKLGLQTAFKWRVNTPLEATVDEALYGIAQEALNNVIRHSQAHNVTVHLIQSGQSLILKIEDDGVGFDPTEAQSGGMGLNTMRERAESLNAQLRVESRVGEGTTVTVEMRD